MDVSSIYDRLVADKFVYAIDHAQGASDRSKKAADILRDWDGRMSENSAAPTIETKARQELVRLTRRDQGVQRESLGPVAFVPLLGGTA